MESDAAFAKSTGKAQGKLQKSNPSLQRSGTVLHVASKTGTGPRTRTRAEADVVHRSGTVLKWRGKVDHDGKSGSGAEVDPTRERTAQTPKSAEQRKKFVEKGGKAQEGRDVTSLTGEHKNSVANPQGQQAEKEQPRNRPHLRLKTSPADLEPDARDGEEENDSLQWGVDNVPPLFSSSSEMPALQHPSPRSLLAVKSLPQLEGFARRRQGGRSSDTTSFSMMSLDFCMSHGHGRCSNSDESGQFASGDVPEAWGSVLKKKEEDAAGCSSVYPSESGSLLESPSSSILRVATLQDVLRNSEENLVSLWEGKKNVVGRRSAGKEDVMRRKSEEKEDVVEWSGEKNEELRIDATKGRREGKKMMSPLSSTDSFIKKELAAVEARIARVAKASTTSSNSKFTEELGSTSSGLERNNTVRAHKRPPRKYSPENGDGSNDWQQSDTQRPGFRHSHVSHEDQDTAGLWEKALQTHRETKADSKSRRSSFSASVGHRSGLENKPKKPILPRLRTSNLFPTNQVTPPKIDPSPTPGGSERHTTGTPEKKRIGTPPSWARYPSHTRDSRTSSAGEDDNVVVRDFVPRAKYPFSKINNQNPNYTFSSQLSKNKKSRSMTFGRNLFKSWSRLYKTQSTDFRRVGKGFRSSVSVGGHVEYPELELIGGGDLPFPHMSKAEEEELPRFIRFSREQARVAAANGATSMSSAGSGESESGMSSGLDRSAKVWSKLYEDCVTLPNSDEHVNELGESSMAMGKIVPTSSSFLGERDALKRSRTRLSRANSSTSGRGLRVSTVDFEKGLREYEERARMETLRVADEAWGR
ncbi:hypothetical protein MMC20_000576 [Loxospora ochrophaea]|nr:hypothetical protein [Loxospora ochrophaea]